MTEFLTAHIYALFWALLVLCLAWFYLHHKKRIRAFLLGGASGLLSLLLLHLFGDAIGFVPSLNVVNLTVSALLGVPGTGLLAAAHYFAA